MNRPVFVTRQILLRSADQVRLASNLLANVPIDPDEPLEVVIRERQKARKPDQNAMMWAGPLRDIATQAWSGGRQFSAEIWHEYFKKEFLPDEYDAELCKDGYKKWDITPAGDRVMIGSTTQLTVRGFSQYLEQILAAGAEFGVMFSAADNRR